MSGHEVDTTIPVEDSMVELTAAELEAVAGGLNPQPLPPIVERDRV